MAKKQPALTIGADPEFMLYSLSRKKMVSAIGVLQNDKYNPTDLGDGIRMYADNVLVEFAFPPVTGADEFVAQMRTVLQRAQEKLGKDYRLVAKAAHIYDEEELSDPKAKEAGCSPNFNVHTQTANKPAKFTDGLRTGSFHIHLGSEALQEKAAKDSMVRLLDCYLGVSSVAFDRDNTAPQRRALYGRAGEFRPTPYGVEYRVLGPYALRSPRLTHAVIGVVEHVYNIYLQQGDGGWQYDKAVSIINNHEAKLAASAMHNSIPGTLYSPLMELEVPDLYRDWNIFKTQPPATVPTPIAVSARKKAVSPW